MSRRLPDGAAIACHPEEGRALDDTIRAVLAADAIGVRPEALEWLRAHLGADHDATRLELGKLALYVGVPRARSDVEAAEACVGEAARALARGRAVRGDGGRCRPPPTAP